MKLPNTPELIELLNNLFDSNAEFANAHSEDFFSKFHNMQTPKLTVLTCSDSRVQIESFDKTPQNEIFVIRNIGNQIASNEGSIDFGIEVLKTPFLLIVGHADCGAVSAHVNKRKTGFATIDYAISTMSINSDSINSGILENVNFQVNKALRKYQKKVNDSSLIIMGAIYDFKDEFGIGMGRLALSNINGITDAKQITAEYNNYVRNFNFINN